MLKVDCNILKETLHRFKICGCQFSFLKVFEIQWQYSVGYWIFFRSQGAVSVSLSRKISDAFKNSKSGQHNQRKLIKLIAPEI